MVYYNLTFCTRKSLMTDLGLCAKTVPVGAFVGVFQSSAIDS